MPVIQINHYYCCHCGPVKEANEQMGLRYNKDAKHL